MESAVRFTSPIKVLATSLIALVGIVQCELSASATFQIKKSGYMARPGGVQQDLFWLDDTRLVFIGANRGDFVDSTPDVKQPRFSLFIWDLKVASITPYFNVDIANGSLCVFRGYVRLTYTSDHQHGAAAQRWYITEGTRGKESSRLLDQTLRDEMRNQERVLNSYTCREYVPSKLPRLGYRTAPLIDGEFVSQQEPTGSPVTHLKYWPANANPITLNMVSGLIVVGRYSAYSDTYVLNESPRHVVSSDTVVRRSWLMDRNGRTRDFTPPSGPWMNGSTFVAPTKRGLFLLSHAVDNVGNGAAGAYLLERGELRRISVGLPTRFDVSADGCRVALGIADISHGALNAPEINVIELC